MTRPSSTPARQPFSPTHWILLAILGGTLLGFLEQSQILAPGTTVPLGQIGLVIIRFIKGLALPLVFFAVLDTLLRTSLDGRTALRFLLICAFNACVAAAVALSLLAVFDGGAEFSVSLRALVESAENSGASKDVLSRKTPNLVDVIGNLLPQNLIEPFASNNILAIVVLALLIGGAVRSLRRSDPDESCHECRLIEQGAHAGALVTARLLRLCVRLVPLAVLGLIAQAVSKLGLSAFSALGPFLMITLSGLAIHGLIYYPLAARFFSGRSALDFLRGGRDAVIMAFAVNSSLATVPVTLRCLSRMGVRESSAHVSVLGGSNFNNDGIVLYEIMAALFLAQGLGLQPDLAQQGLLVVSSVLAAMGIAGVPEAGLVILPIVLGNSGFSEVVIAAVIPLVTPVDWLIGRCRSAVNVLGDMLGACLLDRWSAAPRNPQPEPPPSE